MKKIYIVHGWTKSLEKWENVISELKKSGAEPILLKVPGLTSPIDRVWNMSDYVNWLHNELKNREGKVILLGHSNGGRIIMAYSKLHPEKIDKLILVDSAGVYHSQLPIRLKRFLFGSVARYGKKFTSSAGVKKLLYKLARTKDYNDADDLLKKTLINLWESDKKKIYSQINVPVSIIWGENDTTTPLKDAKLIRSSIKDSELFIIPNSRHAPQFTNTKEFVNIISKILR